MQYTVTSQGTRHFEVFDQQGAFIGKLDFGFWAVMKATITMADGQVYKVDGAGFWGMNREVTRDGVPYAEIKAKMGKGLILTFANGRALTLKKKSMWSAGEYLIFDEAGNELGYVGSWFKWKLLGFHYEVDINNGFMDAETMAVLPLILIYAVRYLRTRYAAAAS